MNTKLSFLVLFIITKAFDCSAQTVKFFGTISFLPPSSSTYAYLGGGGSFWEWDLRSSSQYTGYIGYYGGLYALEAKYVYASNITYTSDESLKKNIQPLINALPVIKKLRPVTFDYNFDYSKVVNEKLKSKLQSDDKDRLGFIAQDVQKILPQSVKVKDSDSTLCIQTTDFIPLLIKGMQEQTTLIDSLETAINEFSESQNIFKNATIPGLENALLPKAVLYQNNPNPFKESTIIYCEIPPNVIEAKLLVFDVKGTLIKTDVIQERNKTSIDISGAELKHGIYIYTLLTDGKEADSKRMVLTN